MMPSAGTFLEEFRIVTLSPGGRPVEVLDLKDGVFYERERGTFQFTPGAPTTQQSRIARRYGGARTVGVTHDNGQISWTAIIRSTNQNDAAARVEALLSQIENAARGRYVEWRPDGLSAHLSSFFQLAGPGTIAPNYQWVEWATGNFLRCAITFPVLPLVEWARETIGDPFNVDSAADYTYDALTSSTTPVTGGVMTASGSLTSERRARHTARGYTHLDHQETRKFTPGATITAFKGGATVRASTATTYVECYVDDNGTNSYLRIDVVIGGARTSRATASLAARVVNGTAFWVRGRVDGATVTAEYFTAAPTPMGTATTNVQYTLTGSETTSLVAGSGGFTWIPQHASATLDDYSSEPRVFRDQALPKVLSLRGVTGTAPAKADVAITTAGGAGAPVWAMLGWARTPSTTGAPFGILEAEAAGDLFGWGSAADGGSRGATRLVDSAVAGAELYAASWTVDPSLLTADNFTDSELSIEVWAVAVITSTLISPRLTASIRPFEGLSYGAERFTDDYGNIGKLLTAPSSGTVRRPVRLGTLTFPADPLLPRTVKLWVAGATGTGSSGMFGLDYLWLVPSRARAVSPSAKPLDATFPKFIVSTSQTTKLVRSDLSATVAKPPANGHPDHGLGGSLLELPGGDVDLLVKLSNRVPDDPTVDTNTEQLAHQATVQVMLTPRSFMLRAD